MANEVLVESGAYESVDSKASGPIGRLSDGTLLLFTKTGYYYASSPFVLFYSKDDGQTWARATGTFSDSTDQYSHSSMFIASDDTIHVLYRGRYQDPYYRFGEWDDATNTVTWSSELRLVSEPGICYDILAWPDATGWCAVAAIYNASGLVTYIRAIDIPSGTKVPSLSTLLSTISGAPPSISMDLKHNGDGRTLDGNPDFWVGYTHNPITYATLEWFTWTADHTWTKQSDVGPVPSDVTWTQVVYDGTQIMMFTALNTESHYDEVTAWDFDGVSTWTDRGTVTGLYGGGQIAAKQVALTPTTGDMSLIYIDPGDGDLKRASWKRSSLSWESTGTLKVDLTQTWNLTDNYFCVSRARYGDWYDIIGDVSLGGTTHGIYWAGFQDQVAGGGWGFIPVGG